MKHHQSEMGRRMNKKKKKNHFHICNNKAAYALRTMHRYVFQYYVLMKIPKCRLFRTYKRAWNNYMVANIL